MSSTAIKSFLCSIPRESRSMGRGESSVRIEIGVIASDHMASCGEVLRCDIVRVVSYKASQTSEVFHPPAGFVDILSFLFGPEVSRKCAPL